MLKDFMVLRGGKKKMYLKRFSDSEELMLQAGGILVSRLGRGVSLSSSLKRSRCCVFMRIRLSVF